jgi:hypothetical protein
MSNPKHLDLTFCQVQSSWTWQSAKSKALDLAASHAQGNVGLTNMPNLKHLVLTVSQVQGNYHPLLARP